MKRREFIGKTLTGSVLGGSGLSAEVVRRSPDPSTDGLTGGPQGLADWSHRDEVVIERAVSGRPHEGKVLAAIQPHVDDVPLFAGGTVAKLISEGYSGYLIRTSNDEMAGAGTTGEAVLNNERDTASVAKVLGLKKVFNLEYRNHLMDGTSRMEMRARLIFLFRMLKVDTVICYDPWGLYEENPDHYVTAQVVEAACWMAGMDKDYPEQLAAGLEPHGVREKYYFARGPQLVNRIVDISAWIDRKVEANVVITTQGPGGNSGARLRARLAEQNRRLPVLGNDDDTANRQYIKNFVLDYDSAHQRGVPSDREVGGAYGLEWAERFHYIGPIESRLEAYIKERSVAR
jgi:LmbE family N-acetylglucosaminyl deacetylase